MANVLSIRTAGCMAKLPSLQPVLSTRRYHEKDMCSPPWFLSVRQANLHKLIDHYMNPRNVGSLNRKDTSVGTGLVGAPACGDVIRLDIQVDEATGTIIDTRFKTFGCGSAIASSSYLTTLIKGKPCRPFATLNNYSGSLLTRIFCKKQWMKRRRSKIQISQPSSACPLWNVRFFSILLLNLTLLTVLVVHCSLLAEDAIKAAIANYQSKRVAAAATDLARTSKAFAKEAWRSWNRMVSAWRSLNKCHVKKSSDVCWHASIPYGLLYHSDGIYWRFFPSVYIVFPSVDSSLTCTQYIIEQQQASHLTNLNLGYLILLMKGNAKFMSKLACTPACLNWDEKEGN